MKKISICIPCYNEEENVVNTFKIIKKVLSQNKKYKFEYIFVDNGSLDNTAKLIKKLARMDGNIKGVFLSKNFGPEASGKASFDYAKGDAVVAIGCDLQDPPELILKFINEWELGFDIVMGTYIENQDNVFTKYTRKIFYSIFNLISKTRIPSSATGFGLYDKKIINTLKMLPEKYRFERGLLSWVGFRKIFISYKRERRTKGKSSYRFLDYLKHAERGIFGFSYMPLDMMVYGGFFLTYISFVFIAAYLYWVIAFGNPINASIPILLAIVFFGGVNLLGISILGKYIQVIVEETKNRPIYIVEDTVNI